MPTLEEYARKMDFRGMMITAIITALAFVTAFFWNDAIRSAIETIVPASDKLSMKFVAALMVTVIVVFIAWLLVKTQELSKKHEEELKKLVKKQSSVIERQRKLMQQRSEKLRKRLVRHKI